MAEKRKRGGNFTTDEKAILSELVLKYREVIENKKTDSSTNAEKTNGWKCLADEFNSVSGHCHRNSDSLKTCWENIKRHSKKDSATKKREMFKTGGGRPTPPSSTGVKNMVEAILGPALEGLDNPYDGDALLDMNGKDVATPLTSQDNTQDTSDTELLDDENVVHIVEVMESSDPIAGTSFEAEKITCSKNNEIKWEGWTPNSLKRPISDALKSNTWQKRRRPNQQNLSDMLIQEKINLVKTLIQNSEEESKRRILILDEQLQQEKIKTQKML